MSDRPLVLYHANCHDGFCAAWSAHLMIPAAEFVPVQYGQEPPDVAGRNVFVLDFSYKRHVMIEIARKAFSLTVLDHHKTAREDFADLTIGNQLTIANTVAERFVLQFDVDKSGGRLAWEYFHRDKKSPWLVDYTEDRDLWRWNLPQSREVNAAIRSYQFDFATWDCLHQLRTVPQLAVEGEGILRRETQLVADHCRHAREIEMDGHKILAVNATCLFSEVAGKLAEGRPFGAAYFIREDGKRVWSLRSRNDGVDVSEVAKRRGGGGHRNAAGFEEDLQLEAVA